MPAVHNDKSSTKYWRYQLHPSSKWLQEEQAIFYKIGWLSNSVCSLNVIPHRLFLHTNSVALHVKWQVIWSWKAPVTVWTFEWLCTSMFSVVSCKFIWASKAPCAAFPGTFVGFLSSVGSPVSLEMWAFSVNFGATFIIAFVDSPSFHMICFTLKWQRIGQFKNQLEHKRQRGKDAKMQKSNREAFVLTQLCESPSHCLCLVQSWMKGILKMLIMKMHLFIPYKYALVHLRKTLLGILTRLHWGVYNFWKEIMQEPQILEFLEIRSHHNTRSW